MIGRSRARDAGVRGKRRVRQRRKESKYRRGGSQAGHNLLTSTIDGLVSLHIFMKTSCSRVSQNSALIGGREKNLCTGSKFPLFKEYVVCSVLNFPGNLLY